MIYPVGGNKRIGIVTILTGTGGIDMSCGFAHRIRAVVAAGAAPQHLHVIDPGHRTERNYRMAVLTDVSGLGVIRRLTDRLNAVVAARAIATDIHMIKIGG